MGSNGKEKLFTGLNFHFDNGNMLVDIFDKKGDRVLVDQIGFLRNLIQINDKNYLIQYKDLEQYFNVLSPRFGGKTQVMVHDHGIVVQNVNIH